MFIITTITTTIIPLSKPRVRQARHLYASLPSLWSHYPSSQAWRISRVITWDPLFILPKSKSRLQRNHMRKQSLDTCRCRPHYLVSKAKKTAHIPCASPDSILQRRREKKSVEGERSGAQKSTQTTLIRSRRSSIRVGSVESGV